MSVFHACDIRGIYEKELTQELAYCIGRAVGVKLANKTVVVGGDVRLSTPILKASVIKALQESGCKILDVGIVATPVFYYALKKYHAEGGIMVTASHNPAPYNGFKLVLGDTPVTEKDIKEIEKMVQDDVRTSGMGNVQEIDVANSYINDNAQHIKSHKLKVVVDAGNGAASLFAPSLYRKAGFNVVELFCEPDGAFPNRAPNPALAENLLKLGEAVRNSGADIGIAFDGDGDRVGVVDHNGKPVDNDEIMVILARHYLRQKSGTIIYDAKCSMVVPEAIKHAGGRPIMARAGHTFSKTAFLAEKALFAGEISGHFFFQELGYDDGMFAGLKICELVAMNGPLTKLIADIPKYYLTPDIRVPYQGTDKETILDEAAEHLAAYRPNRIDGVRIEFIDGWGMIRASVTEPLFTLRFEAKTKQRLVEIQELLLEALPGRVRSAVREGIEIS